MNPQDLIAALMNPQPVEPIPMENPSFLDPRGELPINRPDTVFSPGPMSAPNVPEPIQPQSFNKTGMVKDLASNFLLALGSGLANRGKMGQSTGAGAAMVSPFLRAQQEAAREEQRRQEVGRQMMEWAKLRAQEAERRTQAERSGVQNQLDMERIQQMRRPPQVAPRNIDPLSPEGMKAMVERQKQLNAITPPKPEKDNTPLVESIIKNPELFNRMPPTIQADVVPALTARNFKFPKKEVDPALTAIRGLQETMLRMQVEGGGLTPGQRANEISAMRGQWTKATAPIIARREAIAKVDSGLDALKAGNRNAATQTLVLAFNKLQDEGSVVREGEYARSVEGSPIMSRIGAAIQRLSEGGTSISDSELRKLGTEAKNVATALEQVHASELENVRQSLEETLSDYKIPHSRVFGDSSIGRRQIVVTDPNGGKHYFTSQEEADAFKRAARMK